MQHDEFEKLAIAELDAVYRFARFLTKDAESAEELVQDVYARAFRPESVAGFASRGAGMRAWLMTIARTSFYGRIEHEKAGERAMTKVAQQAMAIDGSAEALDASEAQEIDLALAGSRMHEALDSMSVELREVLWFWGVEGLKYREISEALSVPIGTVMSRLHRARSQAARFLKNDAKLAQQLARAGVIEPGVPSHTAEARD
jgi:RNA polymerase sigma-70 factor (ECF subfamily)